ncbi:unnamed protein product [Nezara viridula]|uniref:Uncharacterized protein n=1 Tax=Nezara viridula TaxID=85310 RepID=A0A9P0MLV3_NEZVI|nr:unnamed protein product [Nezara viridula]
MLFAEADLSPFDDWPLRESIPSSRKEIGSTNVDNCGLLRHRVEYSDLKYSLKIDNRLCDDVTWEIRPDKLYMATRQKSTRDCQVAVMGTPIKEARYIGNIGGLL